MNENEFKQKLDSIKNNEDTFKFFKQCEQEYFYFETSLINKNILELNKKQWEFDIFFNSFSKFGQKQLLQSYLIDEINSTNEIENILSTRHNIFYLLHNEEVNTNSKIKMITNSYAYLLNKGPKTIDSNKTVREVYDYLLNDILKKEDLPDGKYYRKGVVFVSDGIKEIHKGFFPEKLINDSMNEFILLSNSKMEFYVKNIIGHFMFETIHPFYDGNGRLGRFLFTNQLFKDTKSYFSFLISKSFNNNKEKYYKVFKEGRDIHQFGCINDYVEIIVDILINSIEEEIGHLHSVFIEINKNIKFNLNKSETIVYVLLREATYLSDFGVSINELIEYSDLSRRTIVSVIKDFKEKDMLLETSIGRTTYHRLSNEYI